MWQMSTTSEAEVKIDVSGVTAESESEVARAQANSAPAAMELSKMEDIAETSIKTSSDNTTGKGPGKKEYADAHKLWTGEDT